MEAPVAVVTGWTNTIGRAVVLELARRGCCLSVHYLRQQEKAEELCREIRRLSGEAVAVAADVSQPAGARTLIEKTTAAFGRLDVLVNHAGAARDQLLIPMSENDWAQVMAVNLYSAFYCSQAAIEQMIKNRGGRLAHIASVVGSAENPGQIHDAATKSALLGFSASLAKKYGPYGITSNVVAPGFIQGDTTAALAEKPAAEILDNLSLNRLGQPEDVAHAAAFLVSDQAAYITGQCLRVDGGLR
jgi:3-oxoacyl-[acyl-carrier protein] reductase